MITPEPEGIAAGALVEGPRENATWRRTNHAQVAVGPSKHLEAKHEDLSDLLENITRRP